MASEQTVSVERSPSRCPYCRDELDKTKELVACAACGVRHHAACHTAHGACVSCGATELLVPARRRQRADQPPAGSRIEVRTGEDGTTVYEWDPRTRTDEVLIVLMLVLVITIPFAFLIWNARRRYRRASIRVAPEAIEFTARRFRLRQVRVKREDVGAIRVSSMGESGVALTIDEGITRHHVMTGITGPGISAPELEWLAAQLTAWRDEA